MIATEPRTIEEVLFDNEVETKRKKRYWLAAKWLMVSNQEGGGSGPHVYQATIPGTSSMYALLTGQGALRSFISGQATVQGYCSNLGSMRVLIPGIGSLGGDLVGTLTLLPLLAQIPGQATLTGRLTGNGQLQVTIPGIGTFSGNLTGQGRLIALIQGQETTTADLGITNTGEDWRQDWLGGPLSPTPIPPATGEEGREDWLGLPGGPGEMP